MAFEKNFLIGWIGGKRYLRKILTPLIPKDIGSYIEVFGGAAWLMFYHSKWADIEVYNDLDGRLVNLFRVVKYHPQALIDELKFMLGSRELFFEYLNFIPVTDIQKAARFMYLVTRSFGSAGRNFGTVRKSSGGILKSQQNLLERIEVISKRLDKVLIEHLDFEDCLKRYDHEGAFFYLDPPYSEGEGYDIVKTNHFEHIRLRDCLKNIKGKFLLSYDDSPYIRELYKDFELISAKRLNGINKYAPTNKYFKEIIIANYPIKEQAVDD